MSKFARRFGNFSSGHVRVWLGGFIVLLLITAAVFAPWIAPHDPLEQDLISGLLPPFCYQITIQLICLARTVWAEIFCQD